MRKVIIDEIVSLNSSRVHQIKTNIQNQNNTLKNFINLGN